MRTLPVFEHIPACYGLLHMDSKRWWHKIADLLLLVWNKTGTISALVLLASAVGMGLYYCSSPDARERNDAAYEDYVNDEGIEL